MTPSKPLTADRLRELLAYDPETGEFTWRVARRYVLAGAVAGSVNGRGYLRITVDGVDYRAHRLAWLYVRGCWPAHEIDHVNGDKLDNRLANLRDVARAVNNQNLRAAMRSSTTGFLGVSPHRGRRYKAQIRIGDKSKHLGTFDTPEAAHAAYLAAKRQLHPGCTL